MFETHLLASPLGNVFVVTKHGSVLLLDFADNTARIAHLLRKHIGGQVPTRTTPPAWLVDPFRKYFTGAVTALDEIPVHITGTPFENKVWQALRRIPGGSTLSYGQLAAQLERPGAARAVGRANSLNPISLILPCHRVVGTSGMLVGYAGGLSRKAWLLRHEQTPAEPGHQTRREGILFDIQIAR